MDIRERKIEKAGEGWSKHLDNTDFLSAGSNPEWNKTFVFTLSGYFLELTIKLMDSDSFSNDDFLGEAKIPLEPLFMKGRLPPTVYNVVKDHEYHGEIKVGLTFTPIVIFLSHYQFHEILIILLHFTLEIKTIVY